jgi:hypothetical protein
MSTLVTKHFSTERFQQEHASARRCFSRMGSLRHFLGEALRQEEASAGICHSRKALQQNEIHSRKKTHEEEDA